MSTKKKTVKLSDKEAKDIIAKYMREQNRPLNPKMVFENLHGAMGQTQVQKTMDDLAEAGVLVRKDNKKQKIYWTSQDTPEMLECCSGDADKITAELDESIQRAAAAAKAAKSEGDQLAATNKRLAAQPTDAEATKLVEKLREEAEAMEKKLEGLKANTVKVSRKELEASEKKCEKNKSEWRKRKRVCVEIVDKFVEAMGTKKSKFMDDLGIETDEACGITSIDDDESTMMRKRAKKN